MSRRISTALLAAGAAMLLWVGVVGSARAQFAPPPGPNYQPLNHFFYYPYYYFPANYWPTMSPQWPEPPGKPYMRPPAYMAYPPFHEPHWRYEHEQPQHYHRGFHFWLDQF
jgi:hypothetical protein